MDWLIQWLLGFAASNPHIAAILLVMGTARAIFKPIMTVLQVYVDSTESLKDNAWLEALQKKNWFKSLVWVLDYTASIKLPKKSG